MKFVAALAFSDPTHFVELARTADACGWDGLAMSDHLIYPEELRSQYPYSSDGRPLWSPSTPWPDPWVSIGAMAAVTTRLRFLTNVYVLPARDPILVAKAVSTAAVLSHDRVILGIGVGWMREEFDLLGHDFTTRGKRTDEAIAVLRTLWQGGMVEHRGRFYDFGRIQMSPIPTRPVPIYVGGMSGPALRRAAYLGDGWISGLYSAEELRGFIDRLRALRAECGRAAVPFDVCVSCKDAVEPDGYRRLEDIGVTTVLTMPWALYGGSPTELADKQDGLQRFADDVIRRMR
jgi:probable F420-dependent oxidoreductase